jgi:Icc-related predicted phosphoesterase
VSADPCGSEAAEERRRPRLVIVGGARGSEQLGTSLVVAPGSQCDGDYAVVDLRRGSVERAEPARAVGR